MYVLVSLYKVCMLRDHLQQRVLGDQNHVDVNENIILGTRLCSTTFRIHKGRSSFLRVACVI